ncbi:MAG: alkaline phosphatase, partial [Methyloversatilis discipulorum]
MHLHLVRKSVAMAVAVAMTGASIAPAMAAEPAVKGPESVSDWYQNGQQFIADSKKVFPNARK